MKKFDGKKLIVGIVILVIIIIVLMSNKVISISENVNKAKSDIGVVLQRKYDLVTNLVEATRQYVQYEKSIYNEVIEARKEITSNASVKEQEYFNNKLTDTVKDINLLVENYPTLASSNVYINLMDELEGSYNRISVARRDYNDAVNKYNTLIKMFPYNFIAKIMNYNEKEYFEIDNEATNIKVETLK